MGRRAIAALMSACTFAAITSTSDAGLVPVSRNSFVHIEGQAGTADLGKDQSTAAFGTFNQTITSTGGDPAGTHANGSAGQNTIVDISTPGRIVGSGSLSTSAFAQFSPLDTAGPLMVRATSNLTLVLNIVNDAEKIHVDGSFGDISPAGAVSSLTLERAGQTTPVIDDNNVSSLLFDQDITLRPGTYTLTAQTGSGSSGSSPQDQFSFGESHSMNFNFSVGGGATAVPLPATVWTGSVLLFAGIGAAMIAERRRRQI